ncbi:hypothetical protein [Serratia plymuthica]|uniref:hypothetical protein n=1 Tax=Serratia plymuthica TaxID=82996 RepID=UPI0007E97F08|nr:hypothetical protein [Serratia plymuthica]ANJ99429.1 hypothetical protein ADP73_16255 [Serratia plymuthica]
MLKNLTRMKHAITEWAIKEGMFDDAIFLTQKEWNDRGEELHNDALMVLVIDSSGLFSLLNHGCDTTEFEDLVESFGFWYEQGYHWSVGFYPTENYDYSRLTGTYTSKLRDPRWRRKAALVKDEAGHRCQDCGSSGRLEAHHCYYTTMSLGYEPWEYPLSAFRALCPTCHATRPAPEIRARAFLARLTQSQLTGLLDGLDNGFNRFEADTFIQFMRKATFHKKHMDEALLLLKKNTDIYD